jgi:DNA excision repair protein ERCC-2
LINLSVREVVEFLKRSGDIDLRFKAFGPDMTDGTKAHSTIQKQRVKDADRNGYTYTPERRFAHSFSYGGCDYRLTGRADGLIEDGDGYKVEEIKSTSIELNRLTEPLDAHWAQAKFYAYFLCNEFGVGEVSVLITYTSIFEPNLKDAVFFKQSFGFDALESFFYETIEKYHKWAIFRKGREEARNISIRAGLFPFGEFRRGQRNFCASVYRSIQNKNNIFIEAPTGTGKTMSALFPSVKAMGEGLCDKIFYLTAKNLTRQAAQNAADMLIDGGFNVNYSVMMGRDRFCPYPRRACYPSGCPNAAGHYDRVNGAIWDIVTTEVKINRRAITECAARHQVCPHVFAMDVTMFTDIVIGDYNYAFDPKSRLYRYFGDFVTQKYVLLIDEAHNLVERARDMFSASLESGGFAAVRRGLADKGTQIYKSINLAVKELRACAVTKPVTVSYALPDGLMEALADFKDIAEEALADGLPDAGLHSETDSESNDSFLDLYFDVNDFLRTSLNFDERYCLFTETVGRDVTVKQICLDAAPFIAEVLKLAVSSVFFSATLTPLNFFRDVLGGGESAVTARLPSPFPVDNVLVLVHAGLSTKYQAREGNLHAIAEAIYQMAAAKAGNYFAFFPSYEFLEQAHGIFSDLYGNDMDILVQSRRMSEDERDDFLSLFDSNNGASSERSLIAFAVMGGIFSEGIDLIGDRLIGTAVVSVGLPSVSRERDVLRDYYEKDSLGFEYAYMYPGINKVFQSAGRVIRTPTDRGVVLLIDERFAQRRYIELFPGLWGGYNKIFKAEELTRHLQNFWKFGILNN